MGEGPVALEDAGAPPEAGGSQPIGTGPAGEPSGLTDIEPVALGPDVDPTATLEPNADLGPAPEAGTEEPPEIAEKMVEGFVAFEGQRLLGWRDVPVNNEGLGYSVLPTEPVIRQVFIARGSKCADQEAFERKLFVIRKQIENQIAAMR